MEIGVAGPIFTHKTSKVVWGNDIHTQQDGRMIL